MCRRGITKEMARVEMRRRMTLIGAMMVHLGDADGMVCGSVGAYHDHLRFIDEVIGRRPGRNVYAAMNILLLNERTVVLVDTHVNDCLLYTSNYISRKYKVAYDATGPLLNTVYKVGREKQLDPLLLLAVIAIESRYNPLAESHVGAQGLRQVMTSVHQDKFEAVGKNPLDPGANIAVGATILRDCINRRGSVDGGLACYVGSTGPDDNGYGAKVQAERRRLALASGIALARD